MALLDRAYGLDAQQMRTRLPPSTLSIARLLGHMAMVEEAWFRVRFAGLEFSEPWHGLDYDLDRDAEMTLAETWSTEELIAEYHRAIADSRARLAQVESLDEMSTVDAGGRSSSMRWILVHMIEEYARHCGHADLIRESIDGDTCE